MRKRSFTLGILLGFLLALLALPGSAQEQECDVIDFDQFAHGDSIDTLDLFGGDVTLTFDVWRNSPAGVVPATAYDTELWDDAGNPPPNSTHNDTQRAILCNAASNGGIGECDGRILVIPDTDFAENGDDTQGGFLTIGGFEGDFEITSYDAVDSDSITKDIILRVGAGLVQVGTSTGQGNGTVETVITDPHTFTDSAEFEFEGSGGIDEIEICRSPEEPGGEGCTPGYWKQEHHFDSWVGYSPSQSFEAVFGVDVSFGSPTLLEALGAGGGGEYALLRHATAALLNASNDEVDYFETVDGLISLVQEAYATGNFEDLKDLLDERNNDGCPLNGGPGEGGVLPDGSGVSRALSSAVSSTSCGLGAELALLLPPLMWLWRRRSLH